MVKIVDLNSHQLDSQLKKYQKILQELVNEKAKRLNKNRIEICIDFPIDEDESNSISENTDLGGLSFDDTELDKFKNIEKKVEESENEEEVAVTRLINLSKLKEESKK